MAVNTPVEIHDIVICTNVFIRKGDKYLVLHRSPLKIHAPDIINPVGGKVDLNENAYIAAQREVMEEAGVTIKNLRLEAIILEIKPMKDIPHNWQILHFSADYESGEVIKTDEGELIWLTKEELLHAKLFPSVKEVIAHILNPDDGVAFATCWYNSEGQLVRKHVEVCQR